MKLVLLCLIFFGFCQNAQCQNNPFSGLTKVQVPKGGAKSLSFEVIAKGNVTSHIEIKAKIIQGKKVNLVVMYGSQSESCILSKSEEITTLTLCHDSEDKFGR